jgi:hypothetical protein
VTREFPLPRRAIAGSPSPPHVTLSRGDSAWMAGLHWSRSSVAWSTSLPQLPSAQCLVDKCLFISVTCSCWLVLRQRDGDTQGKKPSSLPVRLAVWRKKARARGQCQWSLHRTPLSHTILSFNPLCTNRIKRTLPPWSGLCG